MEIIDGTELQFAPETFDDLMLFERKFGRKILLAI
jgi:hypothetical protein